MEVDINLNLSCNVTPRIGSNGLFAVSRQS